MTVRPVFSIGLVLWFACTAGALQLPYPPNGRTPPPRPNTVTGTLLGGASGSLIGAAYGSETGKTGEGALIGGLIGAAAGGIFGSHADRANEVQARHIQNRRRDSLKSAVTVQQVIQMTRGGLSPDVISNQIRRNGVLTRPTTDDLIFLKQNGVSDNVIAVLQSAPVAGEPGSRPKTVGEVYPAFKGRHIYVRPAPVYRYSIPPPYYHVRPYPIWAGHGHHH